MKEECCYQTRRGPIWYHNNSLRQRERSHLMWLRLNKSLRILNFKLFQTVSRLHKRGSLVSVKIPRLKTYKSSLLVLFTSYRLSCYSRPSWCWTPGRGSPRAPPSGSHSPRAPPRRWEVSGGRAPCQRSRFPTTRSRNSTCRTCWRTELAAKPAKNLGYQTRI